MYGDDTGGEILLAPIGLLRVAVPASAVIGVDLDGEIASTDLFAHLDVERGDTPLRTVRVRGRREFDLHVGPGVRVLRLPDDALQALPAFLSGLQQQLGVVGLAAYEGGFALFVDPSALEPA